MARGISGSLDSTPAGNRGRTIAGLRLYPRIGNGGQGISRLNVAFKTWGREAAEVFATC